MSRLTRARARQAAEAATPAPPPAPPARAATPALSVLETPPLRPAKKTVDVAAAVAGDEENEAPASAPRARPAAPATVADLLASPVDAVEDAGDTLERKRKGGEGMVAPLEAGVARLALAALGGGGSA